MKYALFFLASLPAFCQMGMGMRPPDMPGMFRPVVGSGAEYHISTAREPNAAFAFVIVGQEDGGYWMEIRTSAKGNAVVMKELVAGEPPAPKRMIFQTNGRPPMEMPMSMMGNMAAAGGGAHGSGMAGGGMGAKVGVESVTVPAGTFECEHYTSDSNGKHSDLWISTKVSPYGLVKMTSADTHMELQKILTNETSQIKGEPMKINIPGR